MAVDEKALEELHSWWMAKAEEDFKSCAVKALEYGSHDLSAMGLQLKGLIPIEQEATAQELAVWLYAVGKISRLQSDYAQGKPGKVDSWADLVIYATMARRIQDVGGWPNE